MQVTVSAGEVLHIPSNLPHNAKALEDTLDVDVFSPPRADWLNKTDDFGVRDTIYVAVKTEGASAGSKLSAKWMYQTGQTVSESSQNISPSGGETRHEFHIAKASAWPKGDYKVEIILDGVSAGAKNFSIK